MLEPFTTGGFLTRLLHTYIDSQSVHNLKVESGLSQGVYRVWEHLSDIIGGCSTDLEGRNGKRAVREACHVDEHETNSEPAELLAKKELQGANHVPNQTQQQ